MLFYNVVTILLPEFSITSVSWSHQANDAGILHYREFEKIPVISGKIFYEIF